ncbi:SDR family oxidoreductase, partial [Pseudomonas aeruginosa]
DQRGITVRMRVEWVSESAWNPHAFLCSDLASGISGEILYVDGGFNTTAMGPLDDD